jgi:hypothetical protein
MFVIINHFHCLHRTDNGSNIILQNVHLLDGSEDAACSYKMHVNIYQNTRYHIPVKGSLNLKNHETSQPDMLRWIYKKADYFKKGVCAEIRCRNYC